MILSIEYKMLKNLVKNKIKKIYGWNNETLSIKRLYKHGFVQKYFILFMRNLAN